jgi:hypothetical protein
VKTFLNIIIVVGYILFGTMWLKSLYQVTFYNTFVNIFKFERATTTNVKYLDHSNENDKIIIAYEFEVGIKDFNNRIVANRDIFSEKVGINEIQVIYYNTLVPNINYLENWKLDTFYKLSFVLFSIFLALVVYVHIKVDKGKWIVRYKKTLNPYIE